MSRTVILAAMPGELKPLVRGWLHEQRDGVEIWRQPMEKGECVAAYAGAGVSAVARAFAAVEQGGHIDAVISIGWVGALSEPYKCGQAYRVSGVIDMQSGERFSVAEEDTISEKIVLVTSPRVADVDEKCRLAATYHAGLVDMEAAEVARLAGMRNIPFHCIKGVSDGFTDHLPDFNRFLSKQGKFQLTRFVLFAIMRPWCWLGLIEMGNNSKNASQKMAELMRDFLDNHGCTLRA